MATTTEQQRLYAYTFMENMFFTAEQSQSRFAPKARTLTGLKHAFATIEDQYGNHSGPEEVTGIGQATPFGTMDKDRTVIPIRLWQQPSELFDKLDDLQSLTSLQNASMTTMAKAIGKHYDDKAIEQIWGTRRTGRTGETSTTWTQTAYDGTNGSAATVVEDDWVASSGLTIAKLRAAQTILMAREVLQPEDRICCAITAKQHDDLMSQIETTSREFTDRPAYIDGQIVSWGKYDFIHSERLTANSSSHRRVPVWIERYLVRGMWMEPTTQLLTHADKSGAQSLLTKYGMNWTRSHEEGFVEIECVEA